MSNIEKCVRPGRGGLRILYVSAFCSSLVSSGVVSRYILFEIIALGI